MNAKPIRSSPGISWVAALLALLAMNCADLAPQTPEEVYRVFYQAAAKADWDAAMVNLDPQVLKVFREVGARLSKMVDFPGKPLDFFLQQVKGERATPLRKVEVVDRQKGEVTLEVTAGKCGPDEACSINRVRLIHRQGRWLVSPRLPGLLGSPSTKGKESAK
jgi:hypothetical protein